MNTPRQRVPPNCDRLVWIDFRVFWVDMKFKTVRREDGCIIQSQIKDAPKELWIECIELTYNGANFKDHFGVYDRMFNGYPSHRAVKHAILTAEAAIDKARAA
tara:strand:+ start:1021 stop:1329 length:309 start_codon:yes stop_codon:yes gene_type:complete